MARSTRTRPSAAGDLDGAAPASPGVAAPPARKADAARVLLTHPLDTTQDAAHSMLRWQALQTKALRAWAQTVDDAVAETKDADDLSGVVAVVLKMLGQQVSVAQSQWAECWAQWLEGELRLADRVRREATALVQDLQAPALEARRDDGAALAGGWSRLQGQWLASTRRWIDATQAGAAAR